MPQRSWMPNFIQLFVSQLGSQCAFLTYDELYEKFRHQSLSPLLSNCIAAFGARSVFSNTFNAYIIRDNRYSDIPEVVAHGQHSVADIFSENAKVRGRA